MQLLSKPHYMLLLFVFLSFISGHQQVLKIQSSIQLPATFLHKFLLDLRHFHQYLELLQLNGFLDPRDVRRNTRNQKKLYGGERELNDFQVLKADLSWGSDCRMPQRFQVSFCFTKCRLTRTKDFHVCASSCKNLD